MADTVSKKKRSEIMSKVKSKDSKIEVEFRKAIWKAGFRYSKNPTKYFGKPDLVLKKYKTVIFVDSCFWHGCKRHCRLPATRKKYWTEKIERNKQRDKEVNRYYKKIGWKVVRVWEHEISKNFDKAVNKIINFFEMIDNKRKIILELKIAELQFRLAVAVRLATTLGRQPLDVPTKWSHGKHLVTYEEIFLRKDQANIAAQYLEQTATYLMSLTIKESLKKIYTNPKNHRNNNVVSAYQIARLIRNAFAHSPIRPKWSIDPDCKNKIYTIKNVISLNTSNLDRQQFDWRHYGGLLALFRLSKYVRIKLLKDTDTGKNRKIPKPKKEIIKQGSLILEQIDKIPEDAVEVDPAKFTEETGIVISHISKKKQGRIK